MVLSNKKLKQKLRDSLAQSLTASEEAQNDRTNPDSPHPESKSQPQQFLTSLLGSETRKPRLSKREKRRKNPSLREKLSETPSLRVPEEVKSVEIGDSEKESEEFGLANANEKHMKKKRKTDEAGLESGGLELVDNVVAKKSKKKKLKADGAGLESAGSDSVQNVLAKKSKKKKKKKKKKGKKDDNGEVNEGEKSEVGVTETIIATDSQEIVEVATKVYVGGIPYYSTEDDIQSYFEGCGTIMEVDCMKFPESGKFRGIAIINFKTEAAAKRALAFDGSDMGGLFLKIQPYKSTKPKKDSNFSPSIVKGYNRIYVGNLSWDITEDALRELFLGCNIAAIRFGEDKETGGFRGYAHVDFADSLSLNMALQLDQNMVCGRPVRIRCAVPKKATESNSKSVPPPKEAETEEQGEPHEAENAEAKPKEDDNGVTVAVSGKIRRRTCYECGEKGHLSSSCPNKQSADLTNK